MTLFSYEIFDAVARQGSFNKAAQQLHLTPSAISHAIAVMEEELGFALFNRGKNGVSMTSYGASLYPSIRDVLNSDEALKQSIARLNGLEKGKVKLGVFNSVCASLLPGLLKSFAAHYKNSYLKSANQKNNCSFTFMPVIKKADTYEVFFYCTALPDQEMPEVMAFDITGKEGTKQVEISPRSHKGAWVSLGTYAFEKGNWTSSIKIDGCRSKGALFADAIILVPKK